MNFAQAPQSVEEILKLICRVPTGRKLLDSFLPQFNAQKIHVRAYPMDLLARLKAAVGEGQPVGACFIKDEDNTIYIDTTSPIGVLAPFLVHEIVHSLDQTLYLPDNPSLSKKRKNDMYLQAELRAFSAQHNFVDELKSRYPEYVQFLQDYYPKARVLHDRLTQLEIEDLYGFNAA